MRSALESTELAQWGCNKGLRGPRHPACPSGQKVSASAQAAVDLPSAAMTQITSVDLMASPRAGWVHPSSQRSSCWAGAPDLQV